MCKFKHPNIIKLYGVVSHMDLAYIVMELAPHGQVGRGVRERGERVGGSERRISERKGWEKEGGRVRRKERK